MLLCLGLALKYLFTKHVGGPQVLEILFGKVFAEVKLWRYDFNKRPKICSGINKTVNVFEAHTFTPSVWMNGVEGETACSPSIYICFSSRWVINPGSVSYPHGLIHLPSLT